MKRRLVVVVADIPCWTGRRHMFRVYKRGWSGTLWMKCENCKTPAYWKELKPVRGGVS